MLRKNSPYSLATKLLTLVLITTGCAEHFVPDPSLPPIPPAPPEDDETVIPPIEKPDSQTCSPSEERGINQNTTPEQIPLTTLTPPCTPLKLPPNSQEYRIKLRQRVVSEDRKWIASSPQGILYKISGLPNFDQLEPETEYIIYATFHGTTTWDGQSVYVLRAVE